MTGRLNVNINSVFIGTNLYLIAVIACNVVCFELYLKCLHANKVLAQHLLAAPQG